MEKALVKNAADRRQVKDAKQKEESLRDKQLNDLRYILSTISGRRAMWRLMEHCKPFETVWEPSAKIHYNAGKQDVGHFLMKEIMEADDEAFLLMMKENSKGEY